MAASLSIARGAGATGLTYVTRTPLDASLCRSRGFERGAWPDALLKSKSGSALLESPAIQPPFPFDQLIGSWNAAVPQDASLTLQAKVLVDGQWSGWWTLGRERDGGYWSAQPQQNSFGYVDIDTLKLMKAATAFRWRFLFSSDKAPVVFKLAAVSVSSASQGLAAPFKKGPWVRELAAKPRSQMEEQQKYRRDICSPTALSMALDFWGVHREIAVLAERVRDQRTKIFGDWPFNMAVAAEEGAGLSAYVANLNGLDDLQNEIAQGRPVAVSLTYGLGELSGAAVKRTKGHLVLVVGFTETGDVIVMDPAAPDRKTVRRVYRRGQFDRVWRINKRGVVYLIGPSDHGFNLAVGVPVADLMARPFLKKGLNLHDPNRLSQLLYGEKVAVDSIQGDWARVRSLEQPDYFEGKTWQGYPGWVRSEALTGFPVPAPNATVRTRQALLHQGSRLTILSVGTWLDMVLDKNGASTVRLLDGSTAEVSPDALYPLPPKLVTECRPQVIKTAELFLGTSYYWGGRSGVQPDSSVGVDCSGLVSLAYRLCGVNIPRDSNEQKIKSRAIRRRDLKTGDLVFLSDSARSQKISHVMIYTGGDGLIESRQLSGRVLRSSFRTRFGHPLSEIETGQAVLDYSFPKPRRRRIFFGTYFPKKVE